MTKHKWYPTPLIGLVLLLSSSVVACEPPAPAEFEVVSLDIAPQEVAAGEEVTITVEVENSGGRKDAYTATLTIAGVEEHTKVVEVAPQETEAVLFTVVKDEPGNWAVRVDGLSETFRVLRPAEFTVGNLDISPPVACVGETVTVTADVTNTGEVEGKHSVPLKIDGSEVETRELQLSPGATETVTFSFGEGAIGAHDVTVGELSGLLTVTQTGDPLLALKAIYPELYQELLKLPDLEEVDDRDREAIEDIAGLALNPEYEEAFEAMLDEGIQDKRKYCTPLEALLWIAYDRELTGYTPLRGYSLDELLWEAWENTSTSKGYRAERWGQLAEVADRLNSPSLVNVWVGDNVVYDHAMLGENGGVSGPVIRYVFEHKKGVCRHLSGFAVECLTRAGYDCKNLTVLWGIREGHTVAVLRDGRGLWVVMNFGLRGARGIRGPYGSYAEIAEDVVGERGVFCTYVEDNARLFRRNMERYESVR